MSASESELIRCAQAFREADPDPATVAELQALIDARALDELAVRLDGDPPLESDGVRAPVGAGSRFINRGAMRRAVRAIAEYLSTRDPGATLPVVVGADARPGGRALLEEATCVLIAAGIRVRYFEGPTPAPVVAFAARQLCARAALFIGAGSAPQGWSGYRLYGSSGAPLAASERREIASRLEQIGAAGAVPIVDWQAALENPLCESVRDSVSDRYFECISVLRPKHGMRRDLPIVYTALHGVGKNSVLRALHAAGFHAVHVVEEQAEPNGDFPTLAIPDPERIGALELALALGERVGAELVLANDPSAGQLGAAVRDADGRLRPLGGNAIGILLADYVLDNVPKKPEPLVVQSRVSSPLLASIARRHGARLEQTLVGFDWIWAAALDRERLRESRFAFAYDERLGFSIGDLARDQDGITAAVVLAELAALESSQGSSIGARLSRLYAEHGLWVSAHRSSDAGPGAIGFGTSLVGWRETVARLLEAAPLELGGALRTSVCDFESGAETRPPWLGPGEILELGYADRGRLSATRSGSELRLRVDLRGELGPDREVWKAELAALEMARSSVENWLKRVERQSA